MSTTYKKVAKKNGVGYLKNGKFVAAASLRPWIVDALEGEEEVVDLDRYCVVCDVPAKLSRLLNQQPVYCCEEHYHNMTLGALAAHLRQGNPPSNEIPPETDA